MKKIFFDLMASQPVAGSKFHGGGEYIKTVFQELCSNNLDSAQLYVFYNPDFFIDQWILEKIATYEITSFQVHSYEEVSNIPEFCNADVFFAGLMTGVERLKIPEKMRLIGVYHGFRSLEIPIDKTSLLYERTLKGKIKESLKIIMKKKYTSLKRKEMQRKILCCSDIVGVSDHSGYAAQVFFPEFDIRRVHVFYSPEKYVEPVEGIESVETKKEILMLGGNRWTKNIYRGIVALDELFSNNQLKGYKVKIVGGIPKDIQKKIKNREKFISLGYLSTSDLEKTYKACEFFFYPTLNEGFGYPPQEVMKYGKTCVISAVTSLPEIYRDSVYYCNPYDINEMKMRLLQASKDKIPAEKIEDAYNRIAYRQKKDLKALCELITK